VSVATELLIGRPYVCVCSDTLLYICVSSEPYSEYEYFPQSIRPLRWGISHHRNLYR